MPRACACGRVYGRPPIQYRAFGPGTAPCLRKRSAESRASGSRPAGRYSPYIRRKEELFADLAKQEIALSKAAFLPKLTFNLGYTLDAFDDKFRFKDRNGVGYGTINLSIPIFSGGFNLSKVRKSRLAYEKSKMEYIDLGNQLEKDYLNLLTDKNVAFTQIRTHRKMVELADKEIQASEEKLRLGLITNLELRETRISYIQAKLQLLNATLDYRAAVVNIKNLLK